MYNQCHGQSCAVVRENPLHDDADEKNGAFKEQFLGSPIREQKVIGPYYTPSECRSQGENRFGDNISFTFKSSRIIEH